MSLLHELEKRTLLQIARDAVSAHLAGLSFEFPDIARGNLAELSGVFVTIHAKGRLRGCVGNVQPRWPLYMTTAHSAVAACRDPRFPPVNLGEFVSLHFELSVLTAPEPLDNPLDFEIGEHGLIVAGGRHQGLLLPQVATHQNWDKVQFLEETCMKAGLAPDAWKTAAEVHRFTAQVFSET